jgi:membrane protease YdiL (CAAX protease family)
MRQSTTAPWNPDRVWADRLIATLVLLAILLSMGTLRTRLAPAPLPSRVSPGSPALEVLLEASPSFRSRQSPSAPWDRALLSLHLAEAGAMEAARSMALEGAAPAGPAGEAFRRAWTRAYLPGGPGGTLPGMEEVSAALGHGWGARILEARILERSDPAGMARARTLRAEAATWLARRRFVLAASGLAGILLFLGGLAFPPFLLSRRETARRPLPLPPLAGRTVLLVLLGWFDGLLLSGTVVRGLVQVLPFLRPAAPLLATAFHAALGLGLLHLALGPGGLRRLFPRPSPGDLGSALGHFAMAVTALAILSVVLGPLLRGPAPQQELRDMVGGLRTPGAWLALFATVAVLAPLFEEVMFRGFLLPWMGRRLGARWPRRGWTLAILASAVLFAAMHLQPMGLPALTLLGIILASACLSTGTLWTPVLVHAAWNASVFLLYWLLL